MAKKPWRCRIGWHRWQKAFTPDNEKYLACARGCGKEIDLQNEIPNVLGG
jgi:hypothetical protein